MWAIAYQRRDVVLLVWMHDTKTRAYYFVHGENEKRCWQELAAHLHEEVDDARKHVEVFKRISLDTPKGVLLRVEDPNNDAIVVLYRS